MKSLHGLPLRLVHLELAHRYLVLVALAARFHLVADVDIATTACEALLKQDLVVAHLELVRRKAQFVVLKVALLSVVGLPLTLAVGALWAAVFVTMRASQQN